MFRKLLFLFLGLVTLLSLANAQSFNWGLRQGNTGQDLIRSIKTDADNNLYFVMFPQGALTIDSAGTPKTIPSYGNRDVLVFKYNCDSIFQWVIRIGGNLADGGAFFNSRLAIDTIGNIYIQTAITGTCNLTSANGSNTIINSAGNYDAILVKANSSGIIQWTTRVGGSGWDESGGICLDRQQNVYVSGFFSGAANITQIGGPTNLLISAGNTDIYIAKYNPQGTLQYATRAGSAFQDYSNQITTDSTGALYISGGWGCCGNSTINFGNNVTNSNSWGAFLAKASPTGNWLWGVGIGGAGQETYSDVIVNDELDRVYVLGHFQGNTTVTTRPPGPAVNISSTGGFDVVLAAYNLNGSIQWVRTVGGAGDEYGFAMSFDPQKNIMITGSMASNVNFGGTTLSLSGAVNAYLARYTPNNLFIDAQKVGTGLANGGSDVTVSSSGLAYVSGSFQNAITFGSNTYNSAGSEDAFIARVQLPDTTTIVASKTTLNCDTDSAYIYVTNKNIGDFKWYRNDTLITEANGYMIKIHEPGTYKVVSLGPCSPATTSAPIVINRSTIYTAPRVTDITICRGDSGRLLATGANSYHWSPLIEISDSAVANPVISATVSRSYFLTSVLGQCISLDTVNVIVDANCCLTCSSPLSLNEGTIACYPFDGNARDFSGFGNDGQIFNATLAQDRFARPNRSYQFNGFNSYIQVPTSPSLESPNNKISFTFWAGVFSWNVASGVQFTPIVSKSNGASAGQYRALLRNNGAAAMTGGNAFNNAIGNPNTATNTWFFFAITISNDTVYYYRNGVLMGFATGPTSYVVNNTTPLRIGRNDFNSTSYFNGRLDELRIYNRTLTGEEVSKLYNLSALVGLPLISAGIDKNICKGDTVQITTTGSNGTWLWSPSAFLSSDTARSPLSSPDSTREYVVQVDFYGCKNYDTVKVNVNVFQPDIGSDRAICLGDTAMLVVSEGETFNWLPDYNILGTNNDTAFVFPTVDTSYVVTAALGVCVRTDTIQITVTKPELDAGADLDICDGDTAKFTVSTNGALRWSPFKWLNDSLGTNVYSRPDSNITYFLETTYLGCVARDTVSVTVSSIPIDAGTNQTICLGDTIQLSATGASNFIWIPSNNISDTSVADPFVYPTTPTYYYVISYNSLCTRYDSVFIDVKQAQANAGPNKAICLGDSVVLNGSALGTHIWSPTTGLKDTSLTTYAKPIVTTQYILRADNSICSAYDTVVVTVANFNINAGPDKLICLGDSVQLQASGGVKYNWLPFYNISDSGVANPWVKPEGPTNYFVLSNNGLCWRYDTVFVDVTSFSGSAGTDTSMCKGIFVGLQASGGASYEWLNDANISDKFISNPIVTPPFTQNYIVKIFDGTSCYVYDTVSVEVNDFPTVNAGPDHLHCPDEFVVLTGSVSGHTRFEWAPATYLSDKNALQPSASVDVNTTYVLGAWNKYCYAEDKARVEVNPKVVANFTSNPTSGLAPLPVQFSNQSSNAYFFIWDFGDLSAGSVEKDPLHTYLEDGRFDVTLIASDSLGCSDTTFGVINVNSIDALFLPNAFTPNGDGLNDFFVPIYNQNRFEFLEMKIFNRWGVVVFETKMPGGEWWNGKINGTPEPPGIFSYTVSARDKKGKSYEQNGTVTLIR
ncbi:MAG: gliding motility-associated C-terminal domain-containing protein [Bacteroidia bacterium]|nr:gliding motility-associated C-terminal domain-containing protein [Bacteroidia bacterium]